MNTLPRVSLAELLMRGSRLLFVLVLLLLSACERPVQQMGPRERGVVFRKLPTFLGGGVSRRVQPPGALVVVWPWDSVYRFDTGSRDVALGEPGVSGDLSGFVFTRAKDGNEVALRMTVRYRVSEQDESLVRLIENVATTDSQLQSLVVAVARSAIRQYMNELRTSGFLGEKERYQAVEEVRQGIQSEVNLITSGSAQASQPAVEIMAVMLDRFEFARLLPNGGTDRSYQEKLNEVLRLVEGTEREKLRIETVKAEGERREFETRAAVNRMEQEALGVKNQATARGDAYLTSKDNEAKGILALGKAEVQGMIEKINALEGPGGAAILKLDLARYLQQSQSRFVTLGSSAGEKSLELQKLDTNQLLSQMGIVESLTDSAKTAAERKPIPAAAAPKVASERFESQANGETGKSESK